MALINPHNLYSEGNVSLDSSPYMRIVLQQRAKKDAKDEALDKYYGNLPNTINEQGVRDQEIPIIHQKKDEIQQYFMDNKDKIRKGNTPEAYNYGKMFRAAQGVVQESKNRTNTASKIAKLRGNPKYDYIFKSPRIIDQIQSHDLPVTDTDSQAIDFNQLTLPPPPFDPKKHADLFKDIKSDYKTTTAVNPNDKFTQIETRTPALGEDAKQAIYHRSTEALIDNPSFEENIKKAMDSDPTLIGKLQKTFKDNYGRDINPVTADHDIAAAYTLLGMGNEGVKEKVIPNTDARNKAKNAEWDRRNKITFGQSMAKIAANKKAGADGEDDLGYRTDEYFAKYGKPLSDTDLKTVQGLAGVSPQGYVAVTDIHPNDYDVITGRDNKNFKSGVLPVNLNGQEVFFVDDNGNWLGKNGTIDREAVRRKVIETKANSKVKISQEVKTKDYKGDKVKEKKVKISW